MFAPRKHQKRDRHHNPQPPPHAPAARSQGGVRRGAPLLFIGASPRAWPRGYVGTVSAAAATTAPRSSRLSARGACAPHASRGRSDGVARDVHEARGELVHRRGELRVLRAQPTRVVRRERHLDAVVHVRPLRSTRPNNPTTTASEVTKHTLSAPAQNWDVDRSSIALWTLAVAPAVCYYLGVVVHSLGHERGAAHKAVARGEAGRESFVHGRRRRATTSERARQARERSADETHAVGARSRLRRTSTRRRSRETRTSCRLRRARRSSAPTT